MKVNISRHFLIFLVSLSAANISFGQSTTNEISKVDTENGEHWKFSLSYLSNAVYYGRKDSLTAPYLSPTIRYLNQSGFYAEASLSYLSNNESRIDLGYIGAGYILNNKDSSFNVELYANKYFSNTSSYSVKSALKADAGANLEYNTDIISFTGELYSILSSKVDVNISLGIFKEVTFGNNNEWTFSPAAIMNTGTSNFYDAYFTDKKFSPKRKRRQLIVDTIPTPIVVKPKFGILDYEISAPLAFENNKYGFFITPTLALPLNPVSFSLDKGRTYKTEKLTTTFFVEVGSFIKF